MSDCPYKVGDKLDLGSGVEITFCGQYGLEGVYNAVISHPKGDRRCEGMSHLLVPGQPTKSPVWNVVKWEPLTLTPSFLCHCGFHGFIREGKWVNA